MIDRFRSRLAVTLNVFQVVFVHLVYRIFGILLLTILLTCPSHFNLYLRSYLSTVSTFNSSKFIHSVASRGSFQPAGLDLRPPPPPRPDGKRYVLFRLGATYKISATPQGKCKEKAVRFTMTCSRPRCISVLASAASRDSFETKTQSKSLLSGHLEKHRLLLRSPFLLFILL